MRVKTRVEVPEGQQNVVFEGEKFRVFNDEDGSFIWYYEVPERNQECTSSGMFIESDRKSQGHG
jgi:hypothetical protein